VLLVKKGERGVPAHHRTMMFKKEEKMKRLTKLTLALALGFGLILGGCATTAQTDMSAEEMVEDARKNICEITVAEAKESLDKGGPPVFRLS
jgi:hypothetical protein